MFKVPKITSMQCLYNISRKNLVMKLIFCMLKHESLLQVDTIIFDGFGQACPKYLGKFAISLCDILRKKSGMKLGT